MAELVCSVVTCLLSGGRSVNSPLTLFETLKVVTRPGSADVLRLACRCLSVVTTVLPFLSEVLVVLVWNLWCCEN